MDLAGLQLRLGRLVISLELGLVDPEEEEQEEAGRPMPHLEPLPMVEAIEIDDEEELDDRLGFR